MPYAAAPVKSRGFLFIKRAVVAKGGRPDESQQVLCLNI